MTRHFPRGATSTKPGPRPHLETLEDRVVPAGDMVLRWNEVMLDAIRADRTAPPAAARDMAIVQVAVHDAVNVIYRADQPYAVTRQGPRDASPEAAVAAAAHSTLVALFPAQKTNFDAALAASLADVPDGPTENKGVALGRSVAQEVLALRSHDGSDSVVTYTAGTQPGEWQPTPPAFQQQPLLPQWPSVTPFTMTSGALFRPPPPPSLTSPEYAAAVNEVKAVGAKDSATRTPEQTQIALFWINGPGTATPPGHWNEVAQVVAAGRGNTLMENARLFALLDLALADAGIVSWDAKYAYNFWRPVTAIRAADSDGNPATSADPTWAPLIPTPPFPSYTSGHSTFSAAAAAVLADFFGRDDVPFTLRSETPGVADRSFTSFSQAAQESGLSRIYGGIHYSFDNVQGLATGGALGHFVFAHYLRPDSPRAPGLPPQAAPPPDAAAQPLAAPRSDADGLAVLGGESRNGGASQQSSPGGGGEAARLVLDAVFTAGTGEDEGPWPVTGVRGRRPKTR
jgi:membrane-associated phospholipid phosphatase